jgi:hypothetical protein
MMKLFIPQIDRWICFLLVTAMPFSWACSDGSVDGDVGGDGDGDSPIADGGDSDVDGGENSEPCNVSYPDHTVGIKICDPRAQPGYTFFSPLGVDETYLIDLTGHVLHSWLSDYGPGNSVYLEEDGSILRSENPGPAEGSSLQAGGEGGRVVERAWDGTLNWEYEYNSTSVRQHHDVERLPNGNVLLIAWELKTAEQAIAAGRDPGKLMDNELWPDHIIEVDPSSDAIVWEWHVWDHLIQDFDPTKANYGVVADHPERIDINFTGQNGPNSGKADFNHFNSVDYNAELDQILISSHNQHEVWIIDHSTTTEEAASHSGGQSGRGGDLLFRWGNPRAYGAGVQADQQLGGQHDARWIEAGHPGEGNILIFNNGTHENHSSVIEITPPEMMNGTYSMDGATWGPNAPTWNYEANPTSEFFADHISGAQRLENGNTLICDGPAGRFFEVTSGGEVVWDYINPMTKDGPLSQGDMTSSRPGTGPGTQVFRVWRYPANYPAFDGRELIAGETLELGD